MMPSQYGKRTMDLVLAALALIIFCPVIALTGFFVLLSMGFPVFFRQIRPGLGARPFTLIKFRTMTELPKGKGNDNQDNKRLTALGRTLRQYSLDELPELLNVLRGDMSLVGPRPLLLEYIDLYSSEQKKRHNVRPGITGWAQVNGRNELQWDVRFRHDVWYVEHWSFSLDMKILFKTIIALVKRRGINQPGHVTMPKYIGSGGLHE